MYIWIAIVALVLWAVYLTYQTMKLRALLTRDRTSPSVRMGAPIVCLPAKPESTKLVHR